MRVCSLLPFFHNSHRLQQFLKISSGVHEELVCINLCCSANSRTSIYKSPQKNVVYEFVITSPAVPNLPCCLTSIGNNISSTESVNIHLAKALTAIEYIYRSYGNLISLIK